VGFLVELPQLKYKFQYSPAIGLENGMRPVESNGRRLYKGMYQDERLNTLAGFEFALLYSSFRKGSQPPGQSGRSCPDFS
jgi:hypothetical protein